MSESEALLRLQDQDTVLDQLRHRREHLPAMAARTELLDQAAAVRSRLAAAEAERQVVGDELGAVEAELQAVEERIAELDNRMAGQSGYRELQQMQEEQSHLKERKSTLEDQALDALERREPLDAAVAAVEEEVGALAAELGRLDREIAEAQAEIDRELGEQEPQRAAIAAELAAFPDLVAEYDRLRARLGGVGAAAVVNGSCAGCHLTLPATELDRIKKQPPGSISHCEQCGRILVAV